MTGKLNEMNSKVANLFKPAPNKVTFDNNLNNSPNSSPNYPTLNNSKTKSMGPQEQSDEALSPLKRVSSCNTDIL